MPASNPHLAALQALFGPAPAPAREEELVALPLNLDSAIEADTHAAWDVVLYRWYRGVDAHGVTRIFRFQRGLALTTWHDQLRTQRLTRIDGPFRTQAQATAAELTGA